MTPYPQAKFMEVSTGDDVTARYVYGADHSNSVSFKAEAAAKGAAGQRVREVQLADAGRSGRPEALLP